MKLLGSSSALLSTSTGRYVCCQTMSPTSYQLVAKEQQKPERSSKVTVYKFRYNEDKDICMAFCFEKGKHSVFPVITHDDKVDFKTLTTDEIAGGNFDESFLFKLGEGRNSPFKSLESVNKPDKYLCVDQNKVTIISEDMPDFRVHDLCERKVLQSTNCQPLSRILDQTTCSREKSVEQSKCSNRKGESKRMKFSSKSCFSFCL
ncbi:uncharacterized protein LOC130228428 [Danio aesculapii]|uniref:uncharacterized protein LOC130228428 n=1 Tax=Danio aesculapii TaxID=1142201 RepID=UPI0024C0DDB9|nr:uncharacterized protein LOC130228428 [Danio aesculapii]XP_056312831.1 uncharacterized protein LOC130228428 [Danio aesculapii]